MTKAILDEKREMLEHAVAEAREYFERFLAAISELESADSANTNADTLESLEAEAYVGASVASIKLLSVMDILEDDPEANLIGALEAERYRLGRGKQISVDELLDHIKHTVGTAPTAPTYWRWKGRWVRRDGIKIARHHRELLERYLETVRKS